MVTVQVCIQDCQGCGKKGKGKFPYICPECLKAIENGMTLENIRQDKAIDALLREFITMFKEGEENAEIEELIRSAEKHLQGDRAPNPIGFAVEIHSFISSFLNTSHLFSLVESTGLAEVESLISSVPAPLKPIMQEVLFLAKCERIRKMSIKPFQRI